MSAQNASSFEDLEVYRTALEFRCIARRIEQALPARKREVKEKLLASSANLLREIAHGESAWESIAQCSRILGRLQMVELGGKADVTAGIEVLERIVFLLHGEEKNGVKEKVEGGEEEEKNGLKGKGEAGKEEEKNGLKGKGKAGEEEEEEEMVLTNATTRRTMFPYENWPVYKKALELREIAQQLSKTRTRGLGSDLSQLRRSSSSVVLNIAEGAGHTQPGKKLESYRTALGSAYESGGTCKILEQHVYERELAARGRVVSDEIAAQMIGLIKSVENRQ